MVAVVGQVVEDAPSDTISIAWPAVSVFAAVGVAVSTSPAADPAWVTVIAELVTATPAISNVSPQFAPVIALLIVVHHLVILPAKGQTTNEELGADMSAIYTVRYNFVGIFVAEPEPAPLKTYTLLAAAEPAPLGSCNKASEVILAC